MSLPNYVNLKSKIIQELSLNSRYGKVAAPEHIHARGLQLCRSVLGIAVGFGFDQFEASRLVEGCYKELDAATQSRLHLAKQVVRQCIARLSRSCFEGSGVTNHVKPACLGYGDEGRRHLPLACQAALILQKEGFVPAEIAEIMNARLATIYESLARGNQHLAA